jgi:rhodanese-related sulfurtransferase
MAAKELLQRLNDDQVILLDVRPAEEYLAGSPWARFIPVKELEVCLAELLVDRGIVTYYRTPYCMFADEAVTPLHVPGYQAHQLVQDVPEWRTLGLPVEV